eukprot:g16546.t1
MRKHMQRGLRTRRLAEEDSKQEEDTTNVELFRQSLIQGWGAGEVGRSSDSADWAELVDPDAVQAGDMLLGHPARFFSERTSPAFTRIGLQGGIPADYPRRERLERPTCLKPNMEEHPWQDKQRLFQALHEAGTAKGVWLTLRTGQLLGDFIDFFHSRPLLYGGPTPSESLVLKLPSSCLFWSAFDTGVTMIHPYPEVPGSKKLSDDIYLGGSFEGAQAWVEEGEGSSLRIRFFLNHIEWRQGELAAELAPENTWLPVRCSVDVVLSETDAIDAKPLWVKVAELAGGELEELGPQQCPTLRNLCNGNVHKAAHQNATVAQVIQGYKDLRQNPRSWAHTFVGCQLFWHSPGHLSGGGNTIALDVLPVRRQNWWRRTRLRTFVV